MSNTSTPSPLPTPSQIFQVDALSVRVYTQESELAQDAAAIAQTYLQKLLAQQSAATVVLATGNSQIQFLEALIALGGVDWSRIVFFHLDEYLGIDAEHSASFRRYLRDRVEHRVNPKQFHYIEGDAMQPLEECQRYSQLLRSQPIDLCCLGLGENGHLAFNDPWVASFEDAYAVKLVKLENSTRQQQVNEGHFPSLETVPQYAFTLTIPTICAAKKIICLAPEKRKASAVKQMLQGAIAPDCPASILRRRCALPPGETPTTATLFLDIDSASLLL